MFPPNFSFTNTNSNHKSVIITHEDVDQLPSHLPVLGHEEGELIVVGQFHGYREVGQRDVADFNGASGAIAESVLQDVAG